MKGLTRGLVIFLSTGGFSGYAPLAPGTFGTLAGAALFGAFSFFPVPAYLLATVAFVLLAVWAAGHAERLFGEKDPSRVVVDEMAGYLVTMATFPPEWKYMAAGFVLFRIFDITKPYPVGLIDRRLGGGAGIVLDDVAAGVYANLVLQLVRAVTS